MGTVRGLVLNVDVGAGHRQAGEALCQALHAERPGTFKTIESLDYLGPEVGRIAKDLYLDVQRTLPDLWGMLYEQRPLFELFRPLSELVDGLRVGDLLPEVLAFNPHLVLATHPIACGLGAAMRREGQIPGPLVGVVTDFDGHPAWVANGVDLYVVATTEVGRDLEERGAPAAGICVSGIPLRPGFADPLDAATARDRLGLPRGRFTILLLGGGLGLGPVLETAETFARIPGPLQLVIVAGSNRELEQRARELARRSTQTPVHVAGFVERMWEYMAAADLAVGKPGGMTCAELLAVGVPLLALQPLAGQEESNCRVLERAGAALRVDEPAAARDALLGLLQDPARRERLRLQARKLGRPAAARTAAREVLRLVDRRIAGEGGAPRFRWE